MKIPDTPFSATPLDILIAEDNFIVALDLKTKVEGFGHNCVGPFRTVVDTMASVEAKHPDFAILDVELLDGRVFIVAAHLADLGIPFVFVTARTDLVREAGFDPTRILLKPFRRADLKVALDYGVAAQAERV